MPDRLPALDGYRGLAALLVVVYHAWQHASPTHAGALAGTPLYLVLRSLEAGVAWFFVLSGLLLYLPFARAALEQDGRPSTRAFFAKRALRILPLYYVAILLVWASRYDGLAEERVDLVEHLTFTQTFSQAHVFWTIGPAWSLAVEVGFYLLLPALGALAYAACARLRTRAGRLALLAALPLIVGLASLAFKAWALWVWHAPMDRWTVWFGLPARADGFAAGMLLAVARLAGLRAPAPLRLAGLAVLGIAFARHDAAPAWQAFFHAASALGFALVLAPSVARKGAEGPWERVLGSAPFSFLGAISYSVYLWHEPLMIELAKRGWLLHKGASWLLPNSVAMVGLSVAAGWASYRLVEAPAMRWRSRGAIRKLELRPA